MENRDRLARQSVGIIVMNIVIGILSFFAVICLFVTIQQFYEDNSLTWSENSFYYPIESGEFYRLPERYHGNIQAGFKGNSAMKEYYGVAKYYEAASLYKAFLETGDTVRAEREAGKMEQALAEMGEWSILEEDILAQLGL